MPNHAEDALPTRRDSTLPVSRASSLPAQRDFTCCQRASYPERFHMLTPHFPSGEILRCDPHPERYDYALFVHRYLTICFPSGEI